MGSKRCGVPSHCILIRKVSNGQAEIGPVWSVPTPRVEAQALFKMLGRNGDTVETIRELIGLPPQEEAALQRFAADCPEEKSCVNRMIEFRRRVSEEFDRLLAAREGEKKIDTPEGSFPELRLE